MNGTVTYCRCRLQIFSMKPSFIHGNFKLEIQVDEYLKTIILIFVKIQEEFLKKKVANKPINFSYEDT